MRNVFPYIKTCSIPNSKEYGIARANNSWEFCRSIRDRTNACVSRNVFRYKRGKFCKHLKGFKTKIDRMNEENFAAFFVLLAFIELSFTVTSSGVASGHASHAENDQKFSQQ